ncbi:MAG: peroxiredoxin [Phycisphaerales bacterium]|nr:peroxiredoxin [Phycisphaerales bacterium]
MPTIPVGSSAPDFTLRDGHGRAHRLTDLRGRSVVIFFYPEDDTPLCTGQACQFRDHHADFGKLGCTLLGISPDSVESHSAFAAKHALSFPLLADEPDATGSPRVCAKYGAWGEKNMYGRVVRGMLRTTYLIGPDGRVARRWDRVKTPGHAAKVLAAAKALHGGEPLATPGEGKPVGKLSKSAKKPAGKRSRQATGRAAYTGVISTKGKGARSRSTNARVRVKTERVRARRPV